MSNFLTIDPVTLDKLNEAESELLSNRLKIWDSLVTSKYPSFSSWQMTMCRNMLPGRRYFSSLTSITENFTEGVMVIKGGGVEKFGYTIEFGISSTIYIFNPAKGAKSPFTFPTIRFDQEIEMEFTRLKLWNRMVDSTKKCSRQTNHDFVHNGTMLAEVFTKGFCHANARNENIDGYENYALALNQEIFAELRKIPGEIEKIYSAACEYEHVIKDFLAISNHPDKTQIATVLYEFLYYMLRNLVAGKEFLNEEGHFSHDREKWLHALTYGEKQPIPPFVIRIDGELRETSLAELSNLCYEDFLAQHKASLNSLYGGSNRSATNSRTGRL